MGAALLLGIAHPGVAAGRQILQSHVPAAVSQLQPLGRLSATNRLNLAIGLPLQNETELDDLLRQIYDPASPNFHQYLTPEQFTQRFGPSVTDYQALAGFMRDNGLVVAFEHPNRVVLDVSGSVADIERVFHVTLHTYLHPVENREFYAPDADPSIDTTVPVLNISGLDNYSLPHPMSHIQPAGQTPAATADAGSGPSGTYIGNDFRAAYAPGVSLNGSGQNVALVQFDGYFASDIAAYISQAGISTSVMLTNVPIDGGVTSPDGGNGEVCLDIEMVISMAPGLSKIYVYEAPNPSPWPDMLNRIANDNTAKQIGCSWGGGGPDPTSEAIFKQMAAQGQSFYNASGDSDAFVGAIPFPAESTNITQVGGTTLTTTGPGGAYTSEMVWNERTPNPNGGYWGSSGGISTTYAIPAWQLGINMSTNAGSTTKRNIPDVALTGDNVFLRYNNGGSAVASGTSCAAPLWAGFTSLINQQIATFKTGSVGFINPAIYAIGKGTNYNSDFNDVKTGDNTWPGSPTKFYATGGYDLCTGWGSPKGQSLINALAGTDALGISPAAGFVASGASGGPFTVNSQVYTLTNASAAVLNWQIGTTSSWLNVSSTSGAIPASGQTLVTIGLNTVASNLALGAYSANVSFTNKGTKVVQTRQFTLQVVQPLSVLPTNGITSTGPVGGPFNVTSQNFSLANIGAGSLNWSLINTPPWLDASPTGGTLVSNGSTASVTVTLDSSANYYSMGTYPAMLWFTNTTAHTAQGVPVALRVGQSVIQNGGFETGDFSFWTRANDLNSRVDPGGAISGVAPHSGSFLAALGASGTLGTLSQNVPTVANQSYLLSLWLNNPTNVALASGGQVTTNMPNEFSVSWNGVLLFDQVNIGPIGWTNLQFTVTATNSSSLLQFGERDDPWYLGLDDVAAIPVPYPSFRSVAKMSNSNAVVFSWNSLSNLVYQVQYSTNLASTNWFILSTNIATGPMVTVTNGYGANPQRFYRIRWLP